MDRKSFVVGVLVGLTIVLPLSFGFATLMNNQFSSSLEESYLVSLTISSSGSSKWRSQLDKGGWAVFLRDNITIADGQIWFSPTTNFTIPKGSYTLKAYTVKTGELFYEREIFVGTGMNIFITY